MSDKKHWITKLVPALAFAAGIIIASIAGVQLMSSSLKLALFETVPYTYISKEQCTYDYNKPVGPGVTLTKRTEGEILNCIKEKKNEEKKRFYNNQKLNIIEGVSALIVGGILILAFRKRKQV